MDKNIASASGMGAQCGKSMLNSYINLSLVFQGGKLYSVWEELSTLSVAIAD